jgi:hypothetical protein
VAKKKAKRASAPVRQATPRQAERDLDGRMGTSAPRQFLDDLRGSPRNSRATIAILR